MINKYLYDSILFDFDGVIMDSEPVHFACWQHVLQPFGIEMDWEKDYEHIVGVADYVMIEYFASRCEPPQQVGQLWEKYGEKNRLFVERMAADPPVPNATRELLADLQGKVPMAIVSSSGRSEVEPLLQASGLRVHFDELVCREDVERPKPDPQPYLIAAERFGSSRPLVVEDSDSGATSGRAAGFDVLQVSSPDEVATRVMGRLVGEMQR